MILQILDVSHSRYLFVVLKHGLYLSVCSISYQWTAIDTKLVDTYNLIFYLMYL